MLILAFERVSFSHAQQCFSSDETCCKLHLCRVPLLYSSFVGDRPWESTENRNLQDLLVLLVFRIVCRHAPWIIYIFFTVPVDLSGFIPTATRHTTGQSEFILPRRDRPRFYTQEIPKKSYRYQRCNKRRRINERVNLFSRGGSNHFKRTPVGFIIREESERTIIVAAGQRTLVRS